MSVPLVCPSYEGMNLYMTKKIKQKKVCPSQEGMNPHWLSGMMHIKPSAPRRRG